MKWRDCVDYWCSIWATPDDVAREGAYSAVTFSNEEPWTSDDSARQTRLRRQDRSTDVVLERLEDAVYAGFVVRWAPGQAGR